MAYDYDLLVLGGGPAGDAAAREAAEHGMRVALIERAPDPGGAAVHTGTLPSKTLREAAIFVSGFRARDIYQNAHASSPLDGDAALAQLFARRATVRQGEVAKLRWGLAYRGVNLYQGSARFVDPHRVRIETARLELTAAKIVIATGSSPYQPADIPFEDHDIDDSDSVLLLDRLPRSLVVLGAGVIGCEYASIFASLGVRVTLIEARDRLLPFLDSEIAERLRVSLRKLGVDLRMKCPYKAVRRAGDFIVADLADGTSVEADKLLYAAGRQGNTAGIGLDALGIEPDKRGNIPVNKTFQTSAEHVYAVGDVVGFPALASTSMEQGRVAAQHACGVLEKVPAQELLPYGIYTIPEVSTVGETEESCKKKGLAYAIGRAFYRDSARGKILGDSEGLVKLLFEREGKKKLLGVHILGDRASELVHIGQLALHMGASVEVLVDMTFNHPTLSECYQVAAHDGLARLRRGL